MVDLEHVLLAIYRETRTDNANVGRGGDQIAGIHSLTKSQLASLRFLLSDLENVTG